MSQVIRNRRVEDDRWETLPAGTTKLPAGALIVPLALWKARRDELIARRQPVGVWLEPNEEPGDFAADLGHLHIVAVHFPKWGDGRGYSTATLLRRRYRYRGELRAFGDLGRDHVFMLARVGFDSIRLAERHDPHAALAAFNDFSLRYQGAVDDPTPLFRKRAAGAGLQ
jgi:uncharacterized protein (DUF934 family)